MAQERTIVHLSDLHFGSLNELTVRPLVDALVGFHPDVVAVSGDLTQRARIGEFNQARAFLDELPSPQIVVPGNHDVPLHNLFSRFWHRLARYRQYITPDLEPFWTDESVAIAGINTARAATIKAGRVSRRQVARVCERFQTVPPGITRIIVAHHPFDLPDGIKDRHLVGRAERAMELFAQSEIDVFLTGHLHTSRTGDTAARYRISGHSAVVVQAGTATSTRERGEANSFNIVRINRPEISVQRYAWNSDTAKFEMAETESFLRGADGWKLVAKSVGS